MKNKIVFSFLAIGLLSSTNLFAWQRTAKVECKKQMEECKKNVADCRKDSDKSSENCKKMMNDCNTQKENCRKNIEAQDNASFENQLTKYNRKRFSNFSAEQKKKALDYADNNKMTPDQAVETILNI